MMFSIPPHYSRKCPYEGQRAAVSSQSGRLKVRSLFIICSNSRSFFVSRMRRRGFKVSAESNGSSRVS